MKKVRALTSIDYLTIAVALIASGSAYFFLYHAGVTIIFLFIISIIHFYNKKGVIKNNLFLGTYLILLFFSFVQYGFSFALFGDVLLLLGTYFMCVSFSFENFRRAFLKVVLVMAVISIILELLFIIGLFTPHQYGAGKNGLLGHYIFAFHCFGGGHVGTMHTHLCGIFWEPGIYQIVLNLCLLYNIDLFEKKTNIPWRRSKLVILIGAILMTMSTTGYLCLGIIILGLYFQKSKSSSKNKIFAIFAVLVFTIFILTSSVIIDKFSYDNVSFLVRANDFLGLSKAMLVKPILGLGVYTTTFKKVCDNVGLTGSLSTGFFLQAAEFGLFWLITFYINCYSEFKKRKIQVPTFIYFIFITAIGMTEPLAFTPIILINALPFKKYISNGKIAVNRNSNI